MGAWELGSLGAFAKLYTTKTPMLPHGLRLFVVTMGLDDAVKALSEEQGNLF
ncbi:hypothetical protein [Pseudoalteromonas luteoviolacea]|uniref:hypothetical protein n=1 Tax=Pseudoalteromonas luteoviolacea TaxID=43657 RepID=UPI00159F31BD|nr:hypothetical protein [Pseudoalteromonas luteoviolacea]